jgi:7-cyano-7-deazaguanine synthase
MAQDITKSVVLLSGGLDSAVTAAISIQECETVCAISFDYGQRHIKELQSAKHLAEVLGITDHYVVAVNLSQWGQSALTDTHIPVPTSGIQPHVIPVTYVPGRNTVFLAIALSLAEARQADAIYLGINAVDYSGYPDCRPEYLQAFQELAKLSSKAAIEGRVPRLIAPLVHMTKLEIVQKGLELGVPIEATWSCYQGETEPCGVCDSCRIRDAALIQAGRPDLATPIGRQKWQGN